MGVILDRMEHGLIRATHEGYVTHVEIAASIEHFVELGRKQAVLGLLLDTRKAEIRPSVSFSLEALEDFLSALPRPIPLAALPPAGLTVERRERSIDLARKMGVTMRAFDNEGDARSWLDSEMSTAD